jgi:hypothetical protein
MIEPHHRLTNGCDLGQIQGRRPPQQDDREAERSRRNDFAVSCNTAAVLRDDDVNLMLTQQLAFPVFAEWPTIENIPGMRYGERRFHRVNAANQIAVLRRRGKMRNLLAADGEEHMAGLRSQGARRRLRVMDFGPSIAGDGAPRRPAQRKEGRAGLRGGTLRVSRHRRGIRVRGIDQCVDLMGAQVVYETGSSAEAARSYRHCLRQWRRGAAGQRQSDRHFVTDRQLLAEQSRLRSTTQNEDVFFHVAR